MAKNAQTDLMIKCPHCGTKFSPESAIEHDLRLHLQKEFEEKLTESSKTLEQRIKKQEAEKFKTRLAALEKDDLEKSERLQELEERSVAIEEQKQKLKTREDQLELELRKKLLAKEKVMCEEAEKNAAKKAQLDIREKEQELKDMKEAVAMTVKKLVMDETEKVREAERMKTADIQKKLDDQTKLVNEMKRKSDQGSMQAQGEVQELAIEDYLKRTFQRDEVEEISKGKRGGDCIHIVKDGFGNVCGKILYESKRTKNFGSDWINKLKEDMRLTQADMGVLVTEVLPSSMTHVGQLDGVWICTFAEFKALSFLLCDTLNRIGEVRAAQENKGDKMQLLYHYLTSNEFRQKLEAIVESFQQMQEDLNKEKAQTMSRWSKREKQIYKVMENTVSLYGDVRGIAGTAVKEIEALEVEEVRVLIGK